MLQMIGNVSTSEREPNGMKSSSAPFSYRYDLTPADRRRVRELVESTGVFHDHKVDVAVELVDERLAKGTASGYFFIFAEDIDDGVLTAVARPVHPYRTAATPAIGQPAVAQLPTAGIGQLPVAQIPWAHNILLMQRVKDGQARLWYMRATLENGWSRNTLALMIDTAAHERHGQAVTNFNQLLPAPQSDLAQQTLKDPYIFDFQLPVDPHPAGEPAIGTAHRGPDRSGTGKGVGRR